MTKQYLAAILMIVFWVNTSFAQMSQPDQQPSKMDLAHLMASGLKFDKKAIALKLADIQPSELEAWVLKIFLLRSLMCQVPTAFGEKSCQQLAQEFELKHQDPPLRRLTQFQINPRNREIILRTMAGVFEGAQHSLPPELKPDAQKLLAQIAVTLTVDDLAPLLQTLAKAKTLRAELAQNPSLSSVLPFLDLLVNWLEEMPRLRQQPPEIKMPFESIAESRAPDRNWAFGCGLSKDRRVICWKNTRFEKFSLPGLDQDIKTVNSIVILDRTICVLADDGAKVRCFVVSSSQYHHAGKGPTWFAPDLAIPANITKSQNPRRAKNLRTVGPNQICFTLEEQAWADLIKRNFCTNVDFAQTFLRWEYETSGFYESIDSIFARDKGEDPRMASVQLVPSPSINSWCWLENKRITCGPGYKFRSQTDQRKGEYSLQGSEGAEEIVSRSNWFCYRRKSSWTCHYSQGIIGYKEAVITGTKIYENEDLFCTSDGKNIRCLQADRGESKLVLRTFPGFGTDNGYRVHYGPRDVCRWSSSKDLYALNCITFDGKPWRAFSKVNYNFDETYVEKDRVCSLPAYECAVRPGTTKSEAEAIRQAPIRIKQYARMNVDEFELNCSKGVCRSRAGYAIAMQMKPNAREPWTNGNYYCVQEAHRIVCVDTQSRSYFPTIRVW